MSTRDWAALGGAALLILLFGPKGNASAGAPTIRSNDVPPRAYIAGTPENDALTRAQDAWYAEHPDGPPFVNDDGTLNILPGYELQ